MYVREIAPVLVLHLKMGGYYSLINGVRKQLLLEEETTGGSDTVDLSTLDLDHVVVLQLRAGHIPGN